MKSIGMACTAVALLALTGCESTTRIEARDQSAFLPNLKASFNFGKGVDAPSRPQSGHGIEVEATRGKGSDSQTLSAADLPIRLGGQDFPAPQQLRHNFTFTYADVAWRWRRLFGEGAVGLEVLAGVAHAAVDLTTTSPSPLQASERFSTRGVQGGVGVVWRTGSGTSMQLRATEFASSRLGVNRASRAEVFLNQALASNVTARIGYTGWEVHGDSLSSSSDFRLRFSGPSVGLQFDLGP